MCGREMGGEKEKEAKEREDENGEREIQREREREREKISFLLFNTIAELVSKTFFIVAQVASTSSGKHLSQN